MGNNIFISSADTFDVTIYYKPEGKRLKILTEPEKKTEEVPLAVGAAGTPKTTKEVIASDSIKVNFRYPNFADSQQILRAATTVDANGSTSLNFLQLQTSLLYGLIKEWDVKDERGKPVEVNAANVSKLRVEIAKALIDKVYAELGEGGLI